MKTANYVRSFLKWPGGKYRLLKHIIPLLPKAKELIEPFVGAGVVFLNAPYESYGLNDVNADLINTYNVLKKEGKSFIKHAQCYFAPQYNKPNRYYARRYLFT